MSRKNRKRSDRQRRAAKRRAVALKNKGTPKFRSAFSGKARKGDAATVSFAFSGVLVLVEDWADPSKGLKEKTKTEKARQGRSGGEC